MLKTILKLIAVTVSAVSVAMCSIPLMAGADFDPTVDFDRYATFTWDEADERPTGDPRLDNNPFFVERLHTTIQVRLAERGIRYSANDADLLIHHHATVRHRVEVFSADEARGYEPSGYGEGTEVLQWEEGTFLVDVAERETRRVIWRGWATADIELALGDPAKMTELVHEAVGKMFELFPNTPIRYR